MIKTIYTIALIVIISSGLFSQTLDCDDVVAAIEKDSPGVTFTCRFIDAETGDVVMEHNNNSMVPASIQKLLSTASAIDSLGVDYRFQTKLLKKNSSVVVVGGGDPALGSKYFKNHYGDFVGRWSEIIKENYPNGVDTIFVDISKFGGERVASSWLWEDIGNYYGAGVSPLSCFDNMSELLFKTGDVGEAATLTTIKYGGGSYRATRDGINYSIGDSYTNSVTSFLTSNSVGKDRGYIYSAPFSYDQIVRGTIPANRDGFILKGAAPNPPLVLGALLKERIESLGVDVKGVVVVEDRILVKEGEILDKIDSPSIVKIVEETNRSSVNLFADHLFVETFLKRGEEINFSTLGDRMVDFWKRRGVETKGWQVKDGSGLSRGDRVTAKIYTDILRYILTVSDAREEFLASMTTAGSSGTLRYYFKGEEFAPSIRAKSGSMTGVLSFAGTIKTKKGRELIFMMSANGYLTSGSALRTHWAEIFRKIYNN